MDLPDALQPAGSYAHLFFDNIVGVGGIPAGWLVQSATLEGWVTNTFESATVTLLLPDIGNRPMSPDRIGRCRHRRDLLRRHDRCLRHPHALWNLRSA